MAATVIQVVVKHVLTQLFCFGAVPYFINAVIGVFAQLHIAVVRAYKHLPAERKSKAVIGQVTKHRLGPHGPETVKLPVQAAVDGVKSLSCCNAVFSIQLKICFYSSENTHYCCTVFTESKVVNISG